MGVGIWSTHYVGMLAADLPIPVLYHWPTAILVPSRCNPCVDCGDHAELP